VIGRFGVRVSVVRRPFRDLPTTLVPYTHDGDFDAFYKSTRPAIIRLAYLLTGSQSQAVEAAQEAFIRVLDRWQRLDNGRRHGC
jgi:Sigma-70 region 2